MGVPTQTVRRRRPASRIGPVRRPKRRREHFTKSVMPGGVSGSQALFAIVVGMTFMSIALSLGLFGKLVLLRFRQ